MIVLKLLSTTDPCYRPLEAAVFITTTTSMLADLSVPKACRICPKGGAGENITETIKTHPLWCCSIACNVYSVCLGTFCHIHKVTS